MIKKSKRIAPHFYGLLDAAAIDASRVEVAETGIVRMGLILEVIGKALEPYPEAREALCAAIAERLGSSPETRILP
jgi:hypothetical protein